jgi:hypothetical protein
MPMNKTLIQNITAEQQDLSVLLCKLLYKIYKRTNLEIVRDNPTVVTAYTPDQMRLYDIWRETFSDTTKYWIRVQNGERHLIDFGHASNDGTFLITQEYNYIKALYGLEERKYHNKSDVYIPDISVQDKLALANLENQTPKPNLKSVDAWGAERMKVLLYLKSLLRNNRK